MSDTSGFADASIDALGDTIRDTAAAAKRNAEHIIDQTVDALDDVAATIRSDERVRKVSRSARRVVDDGRRYVESNDLDDMASDVVDAVRRHPGKALIALAAMGLLLSQMLRRK